MPLNQGEPGDRCAGQEALRQRQIVFMRLADRDLLEQPWQGADAKCPIGTVLEGTVTKIMDFGAFIEILPGKEGLVRTDREGFQILDLAALELVALS